MNNVDSQHPDYFSHLGQVEKVRNVYNGIDEAKQYIYKLQRESDTSLYTRQDNATLKNFIKRATDAFVGMIFRKGIETSGLNDKLRLIMDNIDGINNIDKFARDLANNLILDGKTYLAVDSHSDGMSNPYCTIFERGQVINWKKDSYGNFTLLVIKEVIEVIDGFSVEYKDRYRVYREDGTVELYSDLGNGSFDIVDIIETEYDYIPVVEIALSDIPPLYDIAKLTIKHMNRTSIKDKYLDMCATPIPIVWSPDSYNEDDPTKPVYVIGADEGFVFNGTRDECNFEWRELTGSSIDKLQEDLNVIEEDITTGILRASTSDNSTIKTATQAYYEASESTNSVIVMANAIEQGLNKALVFLADIANTELSEESRIAVNKDFNAITGNSDNLRLLWEVYLGGGLSIDTFLDSLNKFEVADIGSVKAELNRIKKDKFVPVKKLEDSDAKESIDNRTISAMEK